MHYIRDHGGLYILTSRSFSWSAGQKIRKLLKFVAAHRKHIGHGQSQGTFGLGYTLPILPRHCEGKFLVNTFCKGYGLDVFIDRHCFSPICAF